MQNSTRNRIYAIVAALLSLVLHLLLIGFADKIQIGSFPGLSEKQKNPRRVLVRTIDIRQRVLENQRIDAIQLTRQESEQTAEALRTDDKIKEIFSSENLITPPKPKLELKGVGENLILPKLEPSEPPRAPTAPRPDIFEIDADSLPLGDLTPDRPLAGKLARSKTNYGKNLPSLFLGDQYNPGSGGSIQVGMRLAAPLPPPDLAKLLPDDPRLNRDKKALDLAPKGNMPDLPTTLDEDEYGTEYAQQIDSLLNIKLLVHRPEQPREDGFFRIDISPNPRSDKLRAIPKDVLFLIDRSNSITPPKLKVFKQAALRALEQLNPRDRFNIVSFWSKPDSLFGGYVQVNPENLAQAQAYIKGLMRGGMTDVYAGLAPFVGEDKDHPLRPLTVFIFTDGQSTVKNHLENEALLQKIVEINRQQVSIYTASCGQDANRFLLDLLAYSNRAMPLHEPELANFQQKIVGFLGTHSDIIVANLDYSLTGAPETEVFPKKLPQLYRGQTLSIYGRFPRSNKEIAIQVVGRGADGTLQEFVFRGNVAKAPDIGRELTYDWVAQKIFHLIVQNTLKPSPAMTAELNSLRRKYNLEIPYL